MKKKGFTLIEMMMTLAIFSIFAVFLYQAYFSQIKENNSFNTRLDLKYNGDKAMNLITEELRSGTGFKTIKDSDGNISKITSGDDTMLIDLKGDSMSSHLTLKADGNSASLIDSNSVVLCKGINSINIQSGNLAQNEGDLLIITITLQFKNNQYTVTSAVNIKN